MNKKLLSCVREYKRPALLSPVFVTLEVIMEVLIPLYMGRLIDIGIDQGNQSNILKIGGLLVILCLVSLAAGVLSGRVAVKAAVGFSSNLRHDMFHKIQRFSFASIDKFSSSSIVTRLTTDVSRIQNAFQMSIRIAIRTPIMLVFSLVMAFRINASVAMVFLVVVPLLALCIFVVMKTIYPIFKRVFKNYDQLNQTVQENLRGIRVVKSCVREDFETKKFTSISERIYRDFLKAERIVACAGPVMNLCAYACIILIAWVGSKVIVTTHETAMTAGQLTSMITYVMQILMSLLMLSMTVMQLIMSRASGDRIAEILNEPETLASPEKDPVLKVADGSIRFDHVRFSYSRQAENPVLDDICLNIPSGSTVGILGGTGSSKSSLVQLIPRLYDVTSGSVRVGGTDVRDYDLTALRNDVAMVLQKNVLFSGTIRDNLRWGREDATDEELVRACRLAQADAFIREFPDGYDTYIEQGGSNVSGGQRQRLCIARALLKKPKILILDDSTSAVDTRTDALIRQALAEEIPDTTKLIISQRIASVQDADLIVVLDAGRVDACGTHEELMQTSAIYREVYDSQTRKGAEQ